MVWLAIAVFASTCLYLIDKNQKWKVFRRVLIWGTVCASLLVGTYAAWEDYLQQKSLAQHPPQIKWDK